MQISLGSALSVRPLSAAPLPPVGETRILLAMGQSNMVDYSANDNAVDWPENVLAMDTETEAYVAPSGTLKWIATTPPTLLTP